MKIAFVLLVCASVVYGEECTTNGDCNTTSCSSGSHVICEHPDPSGGITTNGGLCTCALNNYVCTNKADCEPHWEDIGNCISIGHVHCYDAKCICTRW